jgi:hypothetical protein
LFGSIKHFKITLFHVKHEKLYSINKYKCFVNNRKLILYKNIEIRN